MLRTGVLFCMVVAVSLAAQGPAFDSSGNGMLTGTYSFRHVLYVLTTVPDANGIVGDIGEAVAVYGNISFDGNGNYTIANGIVSDSVVGFTDDLSCYLANAICATGVPVGGTYSISSSGFGFITNPITEDLIYGLVSANGVFAGSSTETTLAYNDLFIGAPVPSTPPANSTFQGSYTVAGFIPGNGSPLNSADAFFQMNPDGAGNLGTVNITGFSGAGATPISQSSSATYSFSGGAATVNFPLDTTASFYTGTEVVYFSPDGNFFFGGSPTDAYDMIVGVRGTTSTQNFAGLYYQAGIDQNESQLNNGNADLDGYYGSFNATSDGNIIDHQRLSDFDSGVQGVTFADSFTPPVTGPFIGTATSAQYAVGAGGAIRIGQDTWPLLGVSVALQAPSFMPTGPVYLSPTGIVNAASYAPFTAGISDGELLTLFGSNLAAGNFSAAAPYPATLGGVQVMVNGIAAPVSYVTPGQVSIVVPFEIASAAAQFQVNNNGILSNIVMELVNQTTPGVFTFPGSGLGYGAVVHSADGTSVSPSSPAQPGETVSVFAAGLGSVSPSVTDGDTAPLSAMISTSNTITADSAACRSRSPLPVWRRDWPAFIGSICRYLPQPRREAIYSVSPVPILQQCRR
jgi:uncharacterized protein (TIGR03437 family)